MGNALLTGVSGLNSHQKMLEVIGNNLANLNSTAYKAQRVLFSDLLYQTVSAASSGANGLIGGINPAQVGSGSQVSQISSNFTQGNLEPTGQDLDFAIDGDGFFVVSGGGSPKYTRAGSFAVDADGLLIDPATGYRVQRFGDAGEPNGIDPSFQTAGDMNIHVPFGASIPGKTTTQVNLVGNVSSDSVGPAAEVLATNAPWLAGGVPATAATLLSALDSSVTPYVGGDSIQFTGTNMDGTPVNTTFNVDATTTVGDLLNAITAAFPDGTATIDVDGNIQLTSNTVGEALFSIQIRDVAGNTGAVRYDTHPFVVSENGRDGTKVLGGFEVFDIRGKAHTVTTTLQKQADGSWNLTATIPDGDGTILDGQIDNIRFNDDGSFLEAGGVGLADLNLSFTWRDLAQPQVITLGFGTQNSYDGMTQLSASSTTSAFQDGYASGTLTELRMSSNGLMEGVATNGRSIPLAQVAIATFRNPSGLTRAGANYYDTSLASGDAEIGTALSGDRGTVKSNYLERSNVDIALEFTQLITAQRGFSANARTITVTDEILQELTGLIR
ncbi:hypothetical protein AYO47_01195 [Planctomyces sp. SCGC AG-212-M04]|nr:hypothetical protein AYO47_01195 [Planctomyces sp. SCGC AG-212-M04]